MASYLAESNAAQKEKRVVAGMFFAGLLYLLCFERVDNLGAYRIPSETGLLIQSDFAS